MSIKVCFCDDNPEILKNLKIRFEKLASEAGIDEYVVDVFDNAQDMIVENTYLQYDAVFMDTSDMSIEENIDAVCEVIANKTGTDV